MGMFSVWIAIGDPREERWETFDALVDTGVSITSVPASVLRSLGVAPLRTDSFTFAPGEAREMDIGQTWVRVEGREEIRSCCSTKRARCRCLERWRSKGFSWESTQ